jgi:nicotinamidase-related amidase
MENLHMASIRSGTQSALVVVDVQVGVMEKAWDAPRAISKVARVVERARAAGVPVVWVQHNDPQLLKDSPEWQWVPELRPLAGEVRVHKQYESSFESTTLESELAARNVSHVVLAGAATNWCIRATAYGALDRGYDLTLVQDAHTTKTTNLEGGFQIQAEQVVQDLNVVMRWISYPGRKSSTATAEDVHFGASA